MILLLNFFLIFLAGIAAGFVNVMAGGGSMLTLPALSLLGLDISVANGTNRIGILFMNTMASGKFLKSGNLQLRRALLLMIPTTMGAIIGAFIAVEIDEELLKNMVGFIFIGLSILIIAKPGIWTKERIVKKRTWLSIIVFFLIGIYGGFLQAGVGFFLMTALVLLEGFDLVKTNANKVFIIACYTLISLIIFAFNGKVDFVAGISLALGGMLGAYIASHIAIKKGANFIRYVVFVAVIASAIKYLFF
ncbi:MAG: sulfite exporter TauE/SafE family protein [Thermotogota bacterium]